MSDEDGTRDWVALRQDWCNRLAAYSTELKRLESDTESEFLGTGARLQEFHQRAAAVAGEAGGIASEITERGIADARERLTALVDELDGYFGRASTETTAALDALAGIVDLLREVRRHLDGFEKLIRMLRMLGVSTKIESSRLAATDTGFDTLSANVATLSVRIDERLEAVADQRRKLLEQVEQTLARVRQIQSARGEQWSAILTETRRALASLRESHTRGSETADVIARNSQEVSRHIAEVVMSMQFHDITRQEMEHADTSLCEIRERLLQTSESPEPLLAAAVAEVAALQSAHLARARDSLVEAVLSIGRNLGELIPSIVATASQTREVSGLLDQAGHAFLAELERGLEPVVARLAADARAGDELTDVMTRVAQAAGAMSGFVDEIERVGSEIEKIALNANVKAAHMGSEGAVLGVLAEAIQRLSVDTRRETAAISGPLRDVLAGAATLERGLAGDAGPGRRDAGGFKADIDAMLKLLLDINAAAIDALGRTDRDASALAQDIERATAGLTVHRRVSESLGAIVGGLEEIAAAARARAPEVAGAAGLLLDSARQRYTTHRERETHELVAAGVTAIPAASEAAPADTGSSEFGDNVELF